jgi:rod shape determining protein RodA
VVTLALGGGASRYFRNFNWPLAVASVLIAIVGIVCIQSANLRNADAAVELKKQIVYIVVGVGAMFGLSFVDYRIWRRLAPYIYVLNLVLLLIILVAGHRAFGAQRWIALGPVAFQPSEAAKLALAIAIAAVMSRGDYEKWYDLWKPLALIAIPALLVLRQPDLGTTLVLLAILTAQLFLGLPRVQYFLIYAAGAAAIAFATIGTNYILKPFQKARLLVFLNPNADPQGAGYNLNQSLIAVGNGQWIGRGTHKGTQTQLNFVPEHSRDFIFTVLAEEYGFLGAIVLLVLYGVIVWGGIRTMLAASDRFGFLLATGIVAMLTFHVIVNIGMTIGIMPITGIPLPFMSYGGSAILTDFAGIGILLNIYAQKDRHFLGYA